MEDEEDRLSNFCANLVSLTRLEPGLVHLFRTKQPGEWVSVTELYRVAGASEEGIKSELAATWLTSPSNQPGYAVIFFCDDELQWNLTVYYNVAWLFRNDNSPLTPAAVPGPAR
jgi:hypothetical protein